MVPPQFPPIRDVHRERRIIDEREGVKFSVSMGKILL